MQGPLPQILQLLGIGDVLVFVAALARVAPLFMIAPLFSSKQIPTQVRAVVAVALAIGLTPAADPGTTISSGPAEVVGMLAVELLVGFSIAFALLAITAALETAGTFLDASIGFSFGAQIDPISGNNNAVLARLYALFGTIIFVTIGGDQWVIEGMARSYELVPIGQTPDIARLVGGADRTFAMIFTTALQVAAPVLLALILADAGFGLVTRVVPQLNIFSIGLPVKMIVGLLLIGITFPLVGTWVQDELERSVASALQSLRVG
ncbi:MAG: flagellar biosynthetic protein FliR [Solirubrobacteraceae bacterium]|nr:flagellar biosynthetic protein FliR [Solirubrobacteraceae bacterium]